MTLGFYHTFHLERIESGPFARTLEELFSSALGRPVKMATSILPRTRTTTPAKSGHLVEAAREMLGDALANEGGEGDG